MDPNKNQTITQQQSKPTATASPEVKVDDRRRPMMSDAEFFRLIGYTDDTVTLHEDNNMQEMGTEEQKVEEDSIDYPIQLTPDNAKEYLGYVIVFRSRGEEVKRKILRVAESGKSISVDFPYLKNTLQIITRKVYVCL